jgi:hypothetical protein
MSNNIQNAGKVLMEMYVQQNNIVRLWGLDVKSKLKSSAFQFRKGKKQQMVVRPAVNGPLDRKLGGKVRRWKEFKLEPKLNHSLYKKFDIYEGIGYRIQQQGVWVHKGVGRGYQMRGGMVVRVDGSGIGRKKESRMAISEPIRRTPVDWFNPVIDANTDNLANQIALVNENAVVNAMRMKIN